MELLQLMYFCDAAKCENFTRVAENFKVPVSGISNAVRRLEKELEVKLFVRSANKIKLSDQGKIFYEDIVQALGIIEGAKRRAGNFENSVIGKINLGILVNRDLLDRIILEFKQEYPEVVFEINFTRNYRVSHYDLIINDELMYPSGCVKKVFLTDKLYLAGRKDNPLFQTENIDITSFKREKFICTNKGSSMFHHTSRICYENGFTPNITLYLENINKMMRYIDAGCGVGIIPESMFDKNIYKNTVLKNIGDYKRNSCVYFEKNKIRTTAYDLFLEKLLNYQF